MNLAQLHNDDWALFLPAMSSFFISGLGKQREGEPYFDSTRIPIGFNGDVECLNFINQQQGLFYYPWFLYSAGHADLTGYATNSSESIVIKRDRKNTFMLADSGGFQILKGQWPADWKDLNCTRALKKRKEVLAWMDANADYGMCLDVPSQSLSTYHMQDKNGNSLHGIKTIEEAIAATHINNEYFINNRNGNCKFLNVLQGLYHDQSDNWYDEMKKYCDPNIYPDSYFNGWAFGGQNKIDIHLTLRRLICIIHDGFLEEGRHDLVHCLGTSILEYAVLFSDIQKAIRKYHNPQFKITFDCASPFFAAAKGLAYNNTSIEHNKKWTYSMEKTAENKAYSSDLRPFATGVIADKIHTTFSSSPITDKMVMKDLCYRGQGFIGAHGKETKTSWDTLSYTLLQAHNVYQHISAVQEANRKYETGIRPSMIMHKIQDFSFGSLVDEIFSLKDRTKSLALLDHHSKFWTQMQSGSQGLSGKKTVSPLSTFNSNMFSITN